MTLHSTPASKIWQTPLARAAGTFALIVSFGLIAWPLVGSPFADAFQGTASLALGSMEFGHGGHADFLPTQRRAAQGADQDASWDAGVRLRIDGVAKTHAITINPRRLIYLPLLFFAGFVAIAPLPARRKGTCLLLGGLVLLTIALLSAWVIVAWIFARVPGLVYDLATWQETVLHMAYEGFVTPIANKFILPLLLALALVSWQTMRERVGAQLVPTQGALPATAPPKSPHAAVKSDPRAERNKPKRRRRKR